MLDFSLGRSRFYWSDGGHTSIVTVLGRHEHHGVRLGLRYETLFFSYLLGLWRGSEVSGILLLQLVDFGLELELVLLLGRDLVAFEVTVGVWLEGLLH